MYAKFIYKNKSTVPPNKQNEGTSCNVSSAKENSSV